MILFYNMLDIAAINAFIIWSQITDYHTNKSHRRGIFLEELGMALVSEQEEVVMPLIREPARDSKKRSRCHICPRTVDKKVGTKCSTCNNYVCTQHSQQNIMIKCNKCE